MTTSFPRVLAFCGWASCISLLYTMRLSSFPSKGLRLLLSFLCFLWFPLLGRSYFPLILVFVIYILKLLLLFSSFSAQVGPFYPIPDFDCNSFFFNSSFAIHFLFHATFDTQNHRWKRSTDYQGYGLSQCFPQANPHGYQF